ncbi:Hypothetical predicted protein [Podarcis lilfordi]|uniref:Uncharacterized protein n=1 Tax=Podarcis lilfordi TaxID=74358 RepID=A0AA35P977_9SAUR|nr:Hypothetical predicted protein [Podarcis lilfordi]
MVRSGLPALQQHPSSRACPALAGSGADAAAAAGGASWDARRTRQSPWPLAPGSPERGGACRISALPGTTTAREGGRLKGPATHCRHLFLYRN